MTEILASKSPVLIQLVAMFFIAWEVSGFSDKNIYRDYNKIRIKIVIGVISKELPYILLNQEETVTI